MTGIGSADRNRSTGIDLLSLPGIFFCYCCYCCCCWFFLRVLLSLMRRLFTAWIVRYSTLWFDRYFRPSLISCHSSSFPHSILYFFFVLLYLVIFVMFLLHSKTLITSLLIILLFLLKVEVIMLHSYKFSLACCCCYRSGSKHWIK